jgi:hypothetical protein
MVVAEGLGVDRPDPVSAACALSAAGLQVYASQ